MQKLQFHKTSANPSLPSLQPLYFRNGPPLPLDQQLHRPRKLQIFSLISTLSLDWCHLEHDIDHVHLEPLQLQRQPRSHELFAMFGLGSDFTSNWLQWLVVVLGMQWSLHY